MPLGALKLGGGLWVAYPADRSLRFAAGAKPTIFLPRAPNAPGFPRQISALDHGEGMDRLHLENAMVDPRLFLHMPTARGFKVFCIDYREGPLSREAVDSSALVSRLLVNQSSVNIFWTRL